MRWYARGRRAADPDRDRSLHRQRRDAGRGHLLELAVEGHPALGEQPTQQVDLLLHAHAAVGEVLAERFVLDRVPAEPDAQAEVALREQVDLDGLLGDERGLPLRQDDDAGHELDRDDGGEVPEQHERFVERRVDVVRAVPRLVHLGIGADHVVVGQQVREPELLDPDRVLTGIVDRAAELGLGEHHTDLHRPFLSPRGSRRACSGGTARRQQPSLSAAGTSSPGSSCTARSNTLAVSASK